MSRFDADAMRRYETARDDVVAQLVSLEHLLDGDGETVHTARMRLQRGKFVLAVVGEFSSGKSFLLNALLGKFRYEDAPSGKRLVGMLATDINPSTAAITELEYAPTDEAAAVYEDGRRERIPLDRLNRFIAVGKDEPGSLHDAVKDERDAPTRVSVHANSPFLQRGFVVADTPGLASVNPAHRRATLGFLPTADAVLYLIDTQQPFSEGDAAFLGIVRRHIDSIFIVQTKIDLWQQTGSDGKPAWEHASERIAALAAVHAPGTYVYAVSARDYALGTLDSDAALVEGSRFPLFVSALDASLVQRTGRARLRRAGDQAATAAASALAQIAADRSMLDLDVGALAALRAKVLPDLDALDAQVAAQREVLLRAELARRSTMDAQGRDLADETEQALTHAFDTADVARLRDRGRLHLLVDRVTAQVTGDYATSVAAAVVTELEDAMTRAEAIAPVRFSLGDAAARAFDAEPGTSLWNGDVRAAIAASIVLDAIGGPAVDLVYDVASRFAARPAGQYMKRELTADLRAEIFPRMRAEILAFSHAIAARMQRIYDTFSAALSAAALQTRDARLGSIDRAVAAHAADGASSHAETLEARRRAIEEVSARIRSSVDGFLTHEDEIAPADAGSARVLAAHADPASLDAATYGKGLRPQRWRVAVLGALRRGKSGLINAFAGTTVLDDDVAGSAAFPIHVRFGERDQAFALSEGSTWEEIPVEHTIAAAATSPVLRVTPWKHPRELVLVHAPAFDSGEANAEDVNLVVAGNSSAVLCLFSRQLSDRELELYARIAEMGKPLLFAHTIADNETAAERRTVVELAAAYLRERNIPATRIFTVSSHEYVQAQHERRAPAAWNELGALIATIEGETEAHMARLARLERAAAAVASKPVVVAGQPAKGGMLARFFRRKP